MRVLAAWPRTEWTPDAELQRATCALVGSVALLALLRMWMALTQWPEFVAAYGAAQGLDTGTPSGRVVAELNVPQLAPATIFDVLAIAVLVLCTGLLLGGWAAARPIALVAGALGAAEATSSLAYTAPWWFVVATVLLVGETLVAGALLRRPGPWAV